MTQLWSNLGTHITELLLMSLEFSQYIAYLTLVSSKVLKTVQQVVYFMLYKIFIKDGYLFL